MSTAADSAAYFKARALEYGVNQPLIDALSASGISAMGQLAFAVSRPGQDFDERRFTDWLRQVNEDTPPSIGVAAAMKRLHFEAEILVTAGLKAMVEQPTAESATPKQIPFAEKVSRMNQLKATLVGITLEGQNEPANALIEECCQQFETRVLKYIEPAKCGSRESEIVSGKTDKKLRIDGASLTVKETKTNPDEAVNTAYSLAMCFRRRGIAYEFANLISYSAHEQYVEKLLRHLSLEPPPNYSQTTILQVLRADQQVFVYLSANVKDIRPSAAGARPLDVELMNALRDYNTAFCLMPLPKESAYQPWRQSDDQGKGRKGPKGGGKSDAKGKQKGSNVAPRGMTGCVGRDAKNRPICFDFNLSECKHAAAGAACRKGRHVCFKAGCFKTHSFAVAHASEMPSKE